MSGGALAFDGTLDRSRMGWERHARLVESLADNGIDVLVLLGQGNVGYASGVRMPGADQSQAIHRRAVAVVTTDGTPPTVWAPEAATVPTDLGLDVRSGLNLEFDDDAKRLVQSLPRGRLAVDDATMPLWRALADRDPEDAPKLSVRSKHSFHESGSFPKVTRRDRQVSGHARRAAGAGRASNRSELEAGLVRACQSPAFRRHLTDVTKLPRA